MFICYRSWGIDNEAKHTARSTLNYYVDHGNEFKDSGIRSMIRGIYIPHETVPTGAPGFSTAARVNPASQLYFGS